MLLTLLSLAFAGDLNLPELAQREGLPAARKALDALVAEAKNDKKLQAALTEAQLSSVKIPSQAGFGADLVLTSVQPVGDCQWTDGLTCTVVASTTSSIADDEFQLRCLSKYGAKRAVTSVLTSQADGVATWSLSGVEACWELNSATLQFLPTSHGDLEGIGKGDDDLIPPELAGLTWGQVEDDLKSRLNTFKVCSRDADPKVAGKLIVAFHIADNGRIDKAEAQTSTLNNKDVEACILDRFLKIQYPPVNDGFADGTFPFSFQ